MSKKSEYQGLMDASFEELKRERAAQAKKVSIETRDRVLGEYASFLVEMGKEHTDELASVYFGARLRAVPFDTIEELEKNRPLMEYFRELSNKHYFQAIEMVAGYLNKEN